MSAAVIFASFLSAAVASLGMGGGGVLILYLTVFLGLEQLRAQGINLIFFLPVAAVALFLHHRNHLIRWRLVLPFAALGSIGVWGGQKLALMIGSALLSKCFGGFLLIIGLRELFARQKPEEPEKKTS